jgi:hypothetical protein
VVFKPARPEGERDLSPPFRVVPRFTPGPFWRMLLRISEEADGGVVAVANKYRALPPTTQKSPTRVHERVEAKQDNSEESTKFTASSRRDRPALPVSKIAGNLVRRPPL